jgi:hypothetical protein
MHTDVEIDIMNDNFGIDDAAFDGNATPNLVGPEDSESNIA